MEKLKSSCDNFNNLSESPVLFLSGDEKASNTFLKICTKLYALTKSHNISVKADPLKQLHVDGFDDEQVWQQIDIFNNESVQTCSKGAAVCLNNWVELGPIDKNDEVTSSSENDQDLSEENEQLESNASDEHQSEVEENEKVEEVFEKTEVDDDFFSLRQMEKFLESQETKKQGDSDDDVDYFDELPSDDSDDDDGGFDDDDDDDASDIKGDDVDDDFANNDEQSSSDEIADDKIIKEEKKQSARDVKYDQFFSSVKNVGNLSSKDDNVVEKMSKFEKHKLKMSRRIEVLEEQALAEKDWQMKGEAVGSKRPVNSLLEEVLSFEHSERAAPEITDEYTFNLETMICQRIKDRAWDDVERKIKEVKDPHEFKKRIVLDQEQSKVSLQEIYEREYLEKISKEAKEDKENPAHVELSSMMTDLFKKLDALANFHYRSAPPDPEIKVVSNLPSIAMEEVQPVTHADADVLAPEEVHNKKEIKGDLEKTSTDRKRERRKKAARQKVSILFHCLVYSGSNCGFKPCYCHFVVLL